jgi:AcrR family transcriptional regulator
MAVTRLTETEAEEPDGRRRRSRDSRARIVAAMLDLTRKTGVSPGAVEVAASAGVGLRTVFRHFKDMESLYGEMTEVIEAELRAVVMRPFVGRTWRERVIELIDRRAAAFESIAPFRRAADAQRRYSPALQHDHARLTAALRQILQREMGEAASADPARFEALDLLLSYEAWDRLRRDQGLSPKAARAALARAVGPLIDE